MGLSGGQRLVSAAVKRPYRVVVAKPGLDGHDRGAKVIARALRDAGFEVDLHRASTRQPTRWSRPWCRRTPTPSACRSCPGPTSPSSPGSSRASPPQGRDDVLVIVGGIIPEADIPVLKEMGVAEVFTPGAPLPAIGSWLGEALDERERDEVD